MLEIVYANTDIPPKVQEGDHGTIVEEYGNGYYEVEFMRDGQTIDVVTVHENNFIRAATREQFMHFFRTDELLNTVSVEEREEIFLGVLLGNSDITKKLLDRLLSDYCVDNIEVSEVGAEKKYHLMNLGGLIDSADDLTELLKRNTGTFDLFEGGAFLTTIWIREK